MDVTEVVRELCKILRNVPVNQLDRILFVVREVLIKVYTTEELLAIANEQIARLRERLAKLVEQGRFKQEQVEEIVAMLESKRETAIAKVANVPIGGTHHLPLLAAIGKDFLRIEDQMTMVQHGGKDGVSYIADRDISDAVELPQGHAWWLIDVENGEQFIGDETTPQDEEAIIAEQDRLRVVATGVIALGIHTNVFLRHMVNATGSRFGRGDDMPFLLLRDKKPTLGCILGSHNSESHGSASCSDYV